MTEEKKRWDVKVDMTLPLTSSSKHNNLDSISTVEIHYIHLIGHYIIFWSSTVAIASSGHKIHLYLASQK